MSGNNVIGLVTMVLSLSIPIVAIIAGVWASIRKNQSETELRRLIIENHTDLETTQALIEKQGQRSNKFTALRWACILIGMGVGALAAYLLGLQPGQRGTHIFFWVLIAFGIGLGLLVSFFVELKLQQKEAEQQQSQGD